MSKLEELLTIQGNKCAICHKPMKLEGGKFDFKKAVMGHIVDRKDGGGDEIENRQLEHYACHRQRHAVPKTSKPCAQCGKLHATKYRRCDECKHAMTLLNAGLGIS